jgi:spermidine synthase
MLPSRADDPVKSRAGVFADRARRIRFMDRATIFVTGAAILALQLIASRVLAPFFGVSLYIWSGILSVTLLCLAVGYDAGGRVTRRVRAETLAPLFYLMPAVSAVATAAACFVYPVVFGPFARFDLLAGSFAAATLLLAVPLVALSALNPLLVAIERADGGDSGDAGAGRVFFISTIGSVAGVAVAAFALIPHLGNRLGIALIALSLAALALAGIAARGLRATCIGALAGAGALVGAALALVIVAAELRDENKTPLADGFGRTLTPVAAYPSFFGAIKVVDADDDGEIYRVLFNDGIFQNSVYPDGRSASAFTYLLDAATRTVKPDAARVLVLGLGAGTVPRVMAKEGLAVVAVELNPRMTEAARVHFDLKDASNLAVVAADARTVAQRCPEAFDIAIVDLFAGDGSPEHLVTREFFQDVRACLSASGVMGLNAFLDPDHPEPFEALLATCVAVFSACGTLETESNGVVIAAREPRALRALWDIRLEGAAVPLALAARLDESLTGIEIHAADSPLVRGRPVLTDDDNRYAAIAAPMQAAYRRWVLDRIPDRLLVN